MDITRLKQCLQFTMGNEGGYSNDPADKGGPTSRGGVTLATLRKLSAEILDHDWDKNDDGYIDEQDLKLLTDDDLIVVYAKYYDGDMDHINSSIIMKKLFDFRFNCGPVSGTKLIQRAVRALGKVVAIDGDLGPKTVAAINSLPEAGLTLQFIDEAINHYKAIVQHDPTQAKWYRGWVNRANRIPHD